jgi:hypothetical protein
LAAEESTFAVERLACSTGASLTDVSAENLTGISLFHTPLRRPCDAKRNPRIVRNRSFRRPYPVIVVNGELKSHESFAAQRATR